MYRDKPFMGILGGSMELDVLQYLTAEPYDFYNISELADILEMNRNTVSRIIKKFESFKLLQFNSGRGRSKCFRLNGLSKIVKSIDILEAGILDETSPDFSVFETTIRAFLPITDRTMTLGSTDIGSETKIDTTKGAEMVTTRID